MKESYTLAYSRFRNSSIYILHRFCFVYCQEGIPLKILDEKHQKSTACGSSVFQNKIYHFNLQNGSIKQKSRFAHQCTEGHSF